MPKFVRESTKVPGITRVTYESGTVRYRLVIDMGERPDGRRHQYCETFTKLSDAKATQAKIMSERKAGTLVRPAKITLAEAIDAWLAGRRNLRPTTERCYRDSLRTAKDRLGHVQLQKLTKAHVDGLVTYMQNEGRRVGNVQRKGLGARSISVTLRLLSAVLDDAVKQGTLTRNVVKLVEAPRQTRKEMRTWTEAQCISFLQAVTDDRLNAVWQLTLRGLRRGEVLGLCWSDIDLESKTLTIRRTRVPVAGLGVVEGPPKTEKGRRTLPLDDGLVAALRSLKTRQARERLEAGKAYSRGCEDCGGAHVVVNELGQHYRPEWYSDKFAALFKTAGVPEIRLHDARHTSVTLMILQKVPIPVVSAWHGHATAAFTLAFYAHSQDDALAAAGQTLASAFSPVQRAQ
jgi:integrase